MLTIVLLVSLALPGISPPPATRQKSAPSTSEKTERISACSLLTRAEVKKLMPWPAMLDNLPNQEDAIGASGSACEYPSVGIQVLPYTPNFIETVRKRSPLETVTGVGDEAYFHYDRNFADLTVKVGKRIVTVQKNLNPGEMGPDAKPSTVALAKALIAKLK